MGGSSSQIVPLASGPGVTLNRIPTFFVVSTHKMRLSSNKNKPAAEMEASVAAEAEAEDEDAPDSP